MTTARTVLTLKVALERLLEERPELRDWTVSKLVIEPGQESYRDITGIRLVEVDECKTLVVV